MNEKCEYCDKPATIVTFAMYGVKANGALHRPDEIIYTCNEHNPVKIHKAESAPNE